MTIDEAIKHAREKAQENRKKEKNYREYSKEDGDIWGENITDCVKCAEEHEQLAEWLLELKSLRVYKERMEIQYLDNIKNPLEPLKLKSALESEIFKYNYRKEHKPKDISPLDYTIMYALKHCLEEQIKESTK